MRERKSMTSAGHCGRHERYRCNDCDNIHPETYHTDNDDEKIDAGYLKGVEKTLILITILSIVLFITGCATGTNNYYHNPVYQTGSQQYKCYRTGKVIVVRRGAIVDFREACK